MEVFDGEENARGRCSMQFQDLAGTHVPVHEPAENFLLCTENACGCTEWDDENVNAKIQTN